MAAAHAAGVIHRDIKPANLLIADDGSVKVSDFGIAKADPLLGDGGGTPVDRLGEGGGEETGALTSTGLVFGTPGYLAPERLAGQPASAATDVWAVGVVCWEALAGRRAFSADTPIAVALAVMTTDLAPIASIRNDVDPPLARAIDGALQRDPARRWPTAQAMRDVLVGGFVEDPPTPYVPVPVLEPVPWVAPRRSPAGVLAVLAIVLLAAIAVVATVLIRGQGSSNGSSGSSSTATTTAPASTTPATTSPAPASTAPPTTAATTTTTPATTTTSPTTSTSTPPTTATPTTVPTTSSPGPTPPTPPTTATFGTAAPGGPQHGKHQGP